jgi:hypothetical protein
MVKVRQAGKNAGTGVPVVLLCERNPDEPSERRYYFTNIPWYYCVTL